MPNFLGYSFSQPANKAVKSTDLILELDLFHMDDTNGTIFCLILDFHNVISSAIQTDCSSIF